jgi:hypothetical protein
MEDERRKFLLGLLALGGGAAVLPELVEAAQSAVKLEAPLSAVILKRQSTPTPPFTDHQFQIEITGANGRQVVSSNLTEYRDTLGNRRTWMTIQTETFIGDAVASDVIAMHDSSRQIDSTTTEITLTMAVNGKVHTSTVRAATPRAPLTTEGLSDEELIAKFFLTKARGGKP